MPITSPVPLAWAAASFVIGAAVLLYIATFHTLEMFGVGTHISVVGVTAFALMSGGLVAASQHPIKWLREALTLRPLRIAGKYSYGMYVYHLVVYLAFAWMARKISPATGGEFTLLPALLFMAAAIIVTTGVAALCFRFFEQPFLNLKRFFPSPGSSD